MPYIFTSCKNLLSPERILGFNKSSNQQATKRTRRLSKQKKLSTVRSKWISIKNNLYNSYLNNYLFIFKPLEPRSPNPNIEYEWTMFFPTHGNISKKGGLCYLLHYKIKTKHAIGKPRISFKLPTITKPVSIPHIPGEDHKTTVSGIKLNFLYS